MFHGADFIRALGMQLDEITAGQCITSLRPRPEHRQQHGFVHACVVAALADHTSGCAAATELRPDQDVITVEFKISFLRPAAGDKLRCVGKLLRSGKTLVFAEAEVFAQNNGEEKLVAKASATLSIIPNRLGDTDGHKTE